MSEYSFSYAIPWILVTVVYLYIALREYKYGDQPQLTKLCVLIFVLFFGLRGFVGWDYASYYPAYIESPTLFDYGDLSSKIEEIGWDYGYSVYMIICKTITSNYHIFIFVSVLIDAILLHYFIKKYSLNVGLSYALFIVFSSSMEIDLLRNTKSILIFLLAIQYISQRKPIQYFSLIVLAMSFHFTAIIYIPLYFFLHRQISQKVMVIMFLVGNLFYLADFYFFTDIMKNIASNMEGIFLQKSEIYLDSGNFDKEWGLSFGFFERTFTWILLLIYNKRMIEEHPESVLFINSILIYLMSYFLIFNIHVALLRMSLVFSFSYWIMYPLFIDMIKENGTKSLRVVILLFIFSYSMIRTSMKTSIMDHYENILFNSSTFDQKMSETYNARINLIDN